MTTASPSMSRRLVDGVTVFVVSMNQVLITGVQSVLACFATVAYGSGEDPKAIQQVARTSSSWISVVMRGRCISSRR